MATLIATAAGLAALVGLVAVVPARGCAANAPTAPETCDAAAGCQPVPEDVVLVPPRGRVRVAFTCPTDRPFLHAWDADVDGAGSVLLRSVTLRGVVLHGVNPGASAISAAVVLGCSPERYRGHALLRKVEGIPAEAPTGSGGQP